MAVLKFMVSAVLLATVGHCQDIYSTYSPGSQYASQHAQQAHAQYSPSIVSRGTPRLVPIKNSQQHQHHQLAYHAAATVAPIVLKRGRVLPAYALNGGSTSSTSGFGLQHYNQPHSIPAVSKYRPPPSPQYTLAQVAPQPVVRHRLQPHYQQHHTQHQPQPIYHQQQPQVAPAPQYYTPVAVATSRPGKYLKAKKPLPPSDPVENEEEEYPSDPNPQYKFAFDIKDDELTNYQNRQEERDGQTIKGSYSVVDPDGYVRTVTYTADSKNGFQAKVTREPTDVKIKFPVPTEAPAASDRVVLKSSHSQGRGQAYHQQLQYQPQYQSASYSHKREVFVNAPAVTVNTGRVADDNNDDETVDEAEVAASGSEPVAVVALVSPSASSAEVASPPEPKEEDITEHTRSRARIIRRVN